MAGEIAEDPSGVAIHRRVIVGRIGRGPTGRALCINCGVRERGGGGAATQFCGAACRREHRARPPKARWQPCPVCDRPCVNCARSPECRAVWQWHGRLPVRTGTRTRLHGGYGGR